MFGGVSGVCVCSVCSACPLCECGWLGLVCGCVRVCGVFVCVGVVFVWCVRVCVRVRVCVVWVRVCVCG